MTIRPWYRSSAVYLAIPMVVCLYLYNASWWFSTALAAGPPYLANVLSQAQPGILVTSAFIAASATIEGYRYRQSGMGSEPRARSGLELAARHLWPTFILCGLAWISAAAQSAYFGGGAPRFTVVALPLAIVQIIILASWVIVGWVIGSSRIGPVGIAGAPLLAFVGTGTLRMIPWRGSSVLSGDAINTCCFAPHVPSASALTAMAAWSIAIALGFLTVDLSTRAWTSPVRFIIGGGSIALLGASLVLARTTPDPAFDFRADAPRCTTESGVEVCLFPEQEVLVGDTRKDVGAAAAEFMRAGINVPTTVTAKPSNTTSTYFFTSPAAIEGPERSYISALFTPDDSCSLAAGNNTLINSYSVAVSWGYDLLGMENGHIIASLQGEELTTWQALMNASKEQQVAWINAYYTNVRTCVDSVPPIPVDTAS
ncbi:MAG: hypothetical protein Q4G21_07435 [Dermabacter sp.]|nr:hypothetical protein [Dermabacter sp.]